MNKAMKDGRFGLGILTALVIGNMVGSGIFMLPRTLAENAGPLAVLLAWLFTGAGVLLLALVFGNLAVRKPHMTGGPQLYAKSLFRDGTAQSRFAGYLTAWGYWVANWAGNVSIIITFASYLSIFFPVMESKAALVQIGSFTLRTGNLITLVICSAMVWFMHFLILRGVEGAGRLNFWATAAKVLGFVLVLIAGLSVFEASNMMPLLQNRVSEDGTEIGFLSQISKGAVNTLWAFIGVESAIVFSSRARKQSDVKKATMLGLFIALIIYIGITVLVMGTLNQEQLMAASNPLAEVLGVFVGSTGTYFMGALGLIAMLGSMLGWIMLSAEVPYQASKQGLFPAVFSRVNRNNVPVIALNITSLMMQVLLLSLLSKSMTKGFDFIILIATLAFMVPYIFATFYQIKMVITKDTYTRGAARWIDGLVAVLAAAYAVWMIKVGTSDLKTFLFGAVLIGSGVLFYRFVPRTTSVREKEASRQNTASNA